MINQIELNVSISSKFRHFEGSLEQNLTQPNKLNLSSSIYTGCLISSVMVSNLHKIIIFYSSEAEILDLDISKLYILVFKIS